jgi:hypothetical protein
VEDCARAGSVAAGRPEDVRDSVCAGCRLCRRHPPRQVWPSLVLVIVPEAVHRSWDWHAGMPSMQTTAKDRCTLLIQNQVLCYARLKL